MSLQWRTVTETNNLGFHVYRVTAKDGDYVRITPTQIKGHGTDSTPRDYSFLDDTAEEGQTYWYLIEDVDFSGRTERSDPVKTSVDPRNILEEVRPQVSVIPTQFALYQNFPNPFNPETWIPYDLSADAPVTITIYNASGVAVQSLSLGDQQAGAYRTRDTATYWDGRGNSGELVSSNLYFYHLKAGDFSATKRMLILK